MNRPTLPYDAYDVYRYESAEEFASDMLHDNEFDGFDDAAMYWDEKHCSHEYQRYQRELTQYEQRQTNSFNNSCSNTGHYGISDTNAMILGTIVMIVLIAVNIFSCVTGCVI